MLAKNQKKQKICTNLADRLTLVDWLKFLLKCILNTFLKIELLYVKLVYKSILNNYLHHKATHINEL